MGWFPGVRVIVKRDYILGAGLAAIRINAFFLHAGGWGHISVGKRWRTSEVEILGIGPPYM